MEHYTVYPVTFDPSGKGVIWHLEDESQKKNMQDFYIELTCGEFEFIQAKNSSSAMNKAYKFAKEYKSSIRIVT